MKSDGVLVIGGGVAGIQTSLDLAERGFKVYLVERNPSLGGRMAQLDKTFPTNDCAMCSLAPKMVEVSKHPNIEVMTCSELESVAGEAGNFDATVKKNPRHVLEEKCTGCGLCAEVCPVNVPNEFEVGIGTRKAIYVPFPQASPLVYTIDKKHCINCGLCKLVCEAKAIDHEQKEKKENIAVGAIVVATGHDLFDPSVIEEYGFGRYSNVFTNVQFERMLSASSSTSGHIIRASDGKEPKRIAFIQCVGSRDVRHCPYCSQICCMASTKEAMIAKEHNSEIEPTIFYMDMRTFGKGFQEYVNKAEGEYGVKYIRSRPSEISEDPVTKNLFIRYADSAMKESKTMEVDAVVLAPALKPSEGTKKLAEILGIKTDDYGFFMSLSESALFETCKPGIFIAGTCVTPRDIPGAITQASGASARASLFATPSNLQMEYPKEKEIEEKPRIGVFVCHCGLNIAAVIDVKEVVKYARTLPDVVFAESIMYTCSSDAQSYIKKAIKDYNLNRVVIASCTPRTHEPIFQGTCREAGLNPYLFEMANIREHDSWVHSKVPEEATEKAKDLVRMAIGKTRLLEPRYEREIAVTPSAIVVGGGIAGMTVALEIAKYGFKVDMIEKGPELGGLTKDMKTLFLEGKKPDELTGPLITEVKEKNNITVHTKSSVKTLKGFIGNFEATIQKNGNEEKIKSGVVVLAIGSQELKPHGRYLYGKNPDVMTLMELEGKMKEDSFDYENVVMIQCVGARESARPYCSRICCIEALKNAVLLKKRKPASKIFVLFRDMMTFGKYEENYRISQEKFGIEYIRYSPENPPRVEEVDGGIAVTAYDAVLGKDIEIKADKVVLSTPQIPSDGAEALAKALKVPLGQDGFFMAAHPKLKPLEFSSDGIYLCGGAQGPKEISNIISQALGAAAKATIPLTQGTIKIGGTIATVNEDLCVGCATCEKVCAYYSIEMKSIGYKKIPHVNEAICKGCGKCAASCPSGAIQLANYKMNQMLGIIDGVAK